MKEPQIQEKLQRTLLIAGILNSPLGSCPVGAGAIVDVFLFHLSLHVRGISDTCSSTECAYMLYLE